MHARRLMLSAVAGAGTLVAFAGLPAGAALAGTGAAVAPAGVPTPGGPEPSRWRRGARTG